MKKIAYVVPYFGKLPDFIEVWLKTCEKNPDIEWLLFTDDHREFSYPQNVKVTYMTFESLRNRIQKLYDFKISLEKPYKLCDYKPAYGEIFKPEISGGGTIFGDIVTLMWFSEIFDHLSQMRSCLIMM